MAPPLEKKRKEKKRKEKKRKEKKREKKKKRKEKKRKEKTMPFGVKVMRSPVSHRAARAPMLPSVTQMNPKLPSFTPCYLILPHVT